MINIINNGKTIEKFFKKYVRIANNLVIYENLDFYKTNNKLFFNYQLHCDFFGCYHGKMFCLELKETHSLGFFNFYKLNNLQKMSLKKINAHQGISLVGIYFISLNKFFIIPFNKLILLNKGGKILLKDLEKNYKFCLITKNNLSNLIIFFEKELANL